MVLQSEQLLETLLDLERSRQRERDLRIETESLLKGLRGISEAGNHQELFLSLIAALRNVIVFEHAFILEMGLDKKMTVLDSTLQEVHNSIWIPGSVFNRALAGKPIASYDVSLVPEWQCSPGSVLDKVTSALHIGLRGGSWEAILIITHSQAKYFAPVHVKKAMRFSPLAAQAFLTLELQQAVIQRDRFFQLSMDVMAIFDKQGSIKQGNDGWTGVLGYNLGDIRGNNIFSFIYPEDLLLFQEILSILTNREGKQLIEVRFSAKNGEVRWLSCSLASYPNEQLFYLVARDITDRVTYESRLAYQAGHDALTGLKNRSEFMDFLKNACRKASTRENYLFSVFFLDLNKFKSINDTLGHDVGDELLKAFAGMLREIVRDHDIVARLGGDEFTILLENIHDEKIINDIASRIHQKCAAPIIIKGHQVKAATSIGVALSNAGYSDAETILKAADLAMYKAKNDPSCRLVMAHTHGSEK